MTRRGRVTFENSNGQNIKTAKPCEWLAPFVDVFIEVEGSAVPMVGLPSFQSLICINLGDPWYSTGHRTKRHVNINGNYVICHADDMFTATLPEDFRFFFVKLKPGVGPLWLRAAASEVEDERIDLLELFSRDDLNQLLDQSCFPSRVNVMQSMLIKIGNSSKVDFKLATLQRAMHLLETKPFADIDKICDYVCTTYPTLRRYFLEYTSSSPKYCQKVIRFKQALKDYQVNGYTFNACSFGYSDFSHFVKDAKAITGESPKYFLVDAVKTVQSNRNFSA